MSPPLRLIPAVPLLAGGLLLAAGLGAAVAVLPEWRARPGAPRGLAARVKTEIEARGGTLSRTSIVLAARGDVYGRGVERAYRLLGAGGRSWLVTSGGAVSWRVSGTLEAPEAGSGPFDAWLAPDGSPVRASWLPGGSLVQFSPPRDETRRARDAFAAKLADWVAGGRPPRGPETTFTVSGTPVVNRPVEPLPGEPMQTVATVVPAGVLYQVTRELSDSDAVRLTLAEASVGEGLRRAGPLILLILAVAVLFGILLFRRRLNFRIGLALGAVALVTMFVGGFPVDTSLAGVWGAVLVALKTLSSLLFLVGLWVVAESLLRDTVPAFTTSLDAFLAGQLGPRGGRALLAGLGTGGALLGIALAGFASSALAAPAGVHPAAPSFPFPPFAGVKNPFFEGTFHAALFVLSVSLFRFVLPRRWAGSAGALLFALYLSARMPLQPWGAALALSLALAIVFLGVFDRYGLASLLAAAVSASLLRDLAVSVRFLPETVLACALAAASMGAIALVGVAGLLRPAREDEARVDAPEYVRRIESERRVKYEMNLLARMQLSLLPAKPPAVPGLELSVTTLLATEAGGDLYHFLPDEAGALWIAAGDVSGHGYSCGIQQAMVMAALASLVKAERSPAEVLGEVDRVLRMGTSSRQFTSLLLLRLDPATGRCRLSNAGHPYPLLLVEGVVREIPMAGLPLGQGPPRTYAETQVELPPGGILVLASDGLFEGVDRFDDPYGYDRPRAVLEGVGLWRRPPDAIIEALFADWRLHVGDGTPADDTTVLVVKRPLF